MNRTDELGEIDHERKKAMKELQIGQGTYLDLPRLIDTRLLVQANSGGGKSWLLRRLLEQSHGKVQHIVLDLDGAFTILSKNLLTNSIRSCALSSYKSIIALVFNSKSFLAKRFAILMLIGMSPSLPTRT